MKLFKLLRMAYREPAETSEGSIIKEGYIVDDYTILNQKRTEYYNDNDRCIPRPVSFCELQLIDENDSLEDIFGHMFVFSQILTPTKRIKAKLSLICKESGFKWEVVKSGARKRFYEIKVYNRSNELLSSQSYLNLEGQETGSRAYKAYKAVLKDLEKYPF
jgi:hypothetical protein